MVKWAGSAKFDLQQIYKYISTSSKVYGKRVIDNIITRSEQSNQFQNSGRMVPEFNNLRIRKVIIYSYRMIYQIISEEDIEVLAIVHTKQNFNLTDNE